MSTAGKELVSAIVPLLNEEENVRPLYRRLKSSLLQLPVDHEIILVDDGSTDSTRDRLAELAGVDASVRVVKLPGNLGQHRAILEGFRAARGSVIVTLDGDLQNPPEEIPRLIERLAPGLDVVTGWRENRNDSSIRVLSSWFLNLFASIATGVRMHDYGCMLRAYRRRVLERVATYGRHTPFIPTLVTSLGARACEIRVEHESRKRGRSKYSLARLLVLNFNLMSDFFHLRFGFRPRQETGLKGKIAFFGYGLVAYECFRMLVDADFQVTCVVTHTDDPGEKIWFPSVEDLARKAGIPVLLSESAKDTGVLSVLRKAKPDLILSVFYREILPTNVLKTARIAAVNLHPALLPEYRGRASLNWAIIRGERRTGVTLHHMVEKVDSGEIIGQEPFEIEREDTIETVYEKTVKASRDILRRLLPAVLDGTAPCIPQDEAKASYFGRRTPEDGRIDWNSSAEEIWNLVRGLTHPFPGAFTSIDGRRLWIWAAHVTEGQDEPGSIICATDGTFEVGTGCGRLVVTRAQLEGREESDGASALGESRWKAGDRFDD